MNKNKIANRKINCIFCDTKNTFKVCSGLCNTELKKYSDEQVFPLLEILEKCENYFNLKTDAKIEEIADAIAQAIEYFNKLKKNKI